MKNKFKKNHDWNLQISILDIYLHDGDGCWGFNLLQIRKDYICYCLLALEFNFPDNKFKLVNLDFLFLGAPLRSWAANLEESMLWDYEPTRLEKICYKLITSIF